MSDAVSIQTKFGTAKIGQNGYYKISSGKEGNFGKFLHRLIVEDFYNTTLPDDWVVHHDNGDKTLNEIWNLIPMPKSEHSWLHHKGMKHSNEAKEKIRKSRLGTTHSEKTKQLFSKQRTGKNNGMYGKHHTDKTKKLISLRNTNSRHSLESKKKHSKTNSSTGFYGVYKLFGNYRNGFTFRYQTYVGKKRISISSVDFLKLRKKVIEKNFHWEILDEDKAKKFVKDIGLKLEDTK